MRLLIGNAYLPFEEGKAYAVTYRGAAQQAARDAEMSAIDHLPHTQFMAEWSRINDKYPLAVWREIDGSGR